MSDFIKIPATTDEILKGNVYSMGIAMGLGSLTKQHWSDK
jgi:hypothetical protein